MLFESSEAHKSIFFNFPLGNDCDGLRSRPEQPLFVAYEIRWKNDCRMRECRVAVTQQSI